jgi:hypothetical protein
VTGGIARGERKEGMVGIVLLSEESAYKKKGDVIKPKNATPQNLLCSFKPYILVLGSTKFIAHSTDADI